MRSYDPRMPVWRCPHCHTPQTESSRCWVCRRSTTCCMTCRHFRKGVAGGLGLCGKDPRHLALNGTEVRPCWVSAPQQLDPKRRWTASTHARIPGDAMGRQATASSGALTTVAGIGVMDIREPRRPRTFVPVDEPAEPAAEPARAVDPDPAGSAAVPVTRMPGTWWLWGDPEPWPEF